MAKILLLEPDYHAKYPPLGLMKIATYHKMRNDEVVFAKGTLSPKSKHNASIWDRVYVTTLFTYEWNETIRTIKYAKRLVNDDLSKVIIGGIASTLMPEEFLAETGIEPVLGQLDANRKLGYEDDGCIDSLPPDYSILDQIDKKYAYANHYFAYTTRGCGMKCEFCAVQTLEPNFISKISIREQIEAIRILDGADEASGELRRDLLLMDNNVLLSPKLPEIIEEIKSLGFGKGAKFKNKRTGKVSKRYVDFNQGLDANLLTPQKARLLGQIAIRPARIAFDHIEDKDKYETAIWNCAREGITEFSNYMLFNGKDFSGKGDSYRADTPEDLYNRLKITMDLKETINSTLQENKRKIAIYSFPMKFVPLDGKKRGEYIGTYWNKKYLRTIQVMLTPTMGKGVSGRNFFKASFGQSVEDFKEFLLMPETLLAGRGRMAKTNSTAPISEARLFTENLNEKIIQEWKRCFQSLLHKSQWIEIIKDNHFKPEIFHKLNNPLFQKLYLFYLSPPQFLKVLNDIKTKREKEVLKSFCKDDAPDYYKSVIHHAYQNHYHYKLLDKGLYRVLGSTPLKQLIIEWIRDDFHDQNFLANLDNLVTSVRTAGVDIDALKALHTLNLLGAFDLELHKEALVKMIQIQDYASLWLFLQEQGKALDILIDQKQSAGEDPAIIEILKLVKIKLHNKIF